MASSNEKQRLRPEPPRKHTALEIHISTKASVALGALLLLLVCLVALALGRGLSVGGSRAGSSTPEAAENPARPRASGQATLCAPGPWGNLEYVRMSIEMPDEYISAHLHE